MQPLRSGTSTEYLRYDPTIQVKDSRHCAASVSAAVSPSDTARPGGWRGCMVGGWRASTRARLEAAGRSREGPDKGASALLQQASLLPPMVSFAASTLLPVSGCIQCLSRARDPAALAPMLMMLPRLAPSRMRPGNRSAQTQDHAQGMRKHTTKTHNNCASSVLHSVVLGRGGANVLMEVG